MTSTEPPAASAGPAAPRELVRLTSLRAFAAATVLVFHLYATYQWHPASYVIDGYTGVAFFFILSGFVLTWSVGDRPIRLARFYRARFARIYPAFFVCFVGCYLLFKSYYTITWWLLVTNVTLTHSWLTLSHRAPANLGYSIDGPTWSVSCEVFFYAALPLVVTFARRLSPGRFALIAGAWFAVCAAITYGVPHHYDYAFWSRAVYSNPVVRSGELGLGIAACLLVRQGRLPHLRVSPCVVAVVVSFVAIYQWHDRPFPFADIMMAPSLLALIIACAQADLAGERGVLTHRTLRYAGEISYSVYVVQFIPLLYVGVHLHASAAARSAVTVPATILLAIVLHHVVERPLRAWITHRPQPQIGAVVAPPEEAPVTT